MNTVQASEIDQWIKSLGMKTTAAQYMEDILKDLWTTQDLPDLCTRLNLLCQVEERYKLW
jgi:hypothetical protein